MNKKNSAGVLFSASTVVGCGVHVQLFFLCFLGYFYYCKPSTFDSFYNFIFSKQRERSRRAAAIRRRKKTRKRERFMLKYARGEIFKCRKISVIKINLLQLPGVRSNLSFQIYVHKDCFRESFITFSASWTIYHQQLVREKETERIFWEMECEDTLATVISGVTS